jgi:hypothetical protein
VGSAAENLAISNYVNADAWIGAAATAVGSTRTWTWVASNTVDGLDGALLATDGHGNLPCLVARGGTATTNGYQNWYDYDDTTLTTTGRALEDYLEPNNCSGGAAETSLLMYSVWKNADGSTWNDVAPADNAKYIWEYASATPLSLNASFTTAVSDPSATPPSSSPAGSAPPQASSDPALAATGVSLSFEAALAATLGATGLLMLLLARRVSKNTLQSK